MIRTGWNRSYASLLALALSTALAATACDDSGSSNGDAGQGGANGDASTSNAMLQVTPGTKDFGNVAIGSTSTPQVFTVVNSGQNASGALNSTFDGAGASDFIPGANTCAGVQLMPGSSCTITVSFKPAAAGPSAAALKVTGKGSEAAGAGLLGTGVSAAALLVSPSTPSFGTVVINTDSAVIPLTITNTGGVTSGVPVVSISGTDAAMFTIVMETCSAMTGGLAPAGTCTVQVRFRPGTIGAKVAQLAVTGLPANPGSAVLSGVGIIGADLVLTPTPQDYGDVLVGSTSPAATFTLRNNGGNAAEKIAVSFAGTNPDQFEQGATTCGMTLAVGATCTITVTFKPKSVGNKQARLEVNGSPGGSVNASLLGRGLAPARLGISPGSQNFGQVVSGSSSSNVTFTVSNSGGEATSALTLAITGEFTIVSDGCGTNPVAANGSCQVQVQFRPTSTGAKTGTLTASATTGGSTTANLSGDGLSVGSLTISPSPFAFTPTTVGSATNAVAFTVTNTGQSQSSAIGISMGGAHPGDFTIAPGGNGCSGIQLAGGGTCMVSVIFGPTAAGARAAALNFSASTGGSGSAILTGNGLSNASLQATPPNQDFGSVVIAQTSGQVNFVIRNNGQVATAALTASISGAQANNFNVVNSQCNGQSLAPGGVATCTVTVTFTPVDEGTKNATLVVGDGTVSVSVPITGQGQRPASLIVTPTPQDFGSAVADQAGQNIQFTLTNLGGAASGNLTFAFLNDAEGNFEYTVAQNFCPPTGIGSGLMCTFFVRFVPKTSGAKAASIQVTSDMAGVATGAISGTGLPKTTISPAATENFGTAPAGIILLTNHATYNQIFTVSCTDGGANCGPYVVSLSGDDAVDWQIISNGCGSGTHAPDTSCDINVQFRPRTVAASKSATLNVTVAGDSEQNLSVGLTGASRSPIQLFYCAEGCTRLTAPYSYGQTIIGSYATAGFTLEYESLMPPTEAVSTFLTGANQGAFSVFTGGCVGNGQSSPNTCVVDVGFVPVASGLQSATVNVRVPFTSNDDYPGDVALDFVFTEDQELSGTGIPGPNIQLVSITPSPVTTVSGTDSAIVTAVFQNTAGSITSGTLNYEVWNAPLSGAVTGTCLTASNTLDGGETCTIIFQIDGTPPPGVTSGLGYVYLSEGLSGSSAQGSYYWNINAQLTVVQDAPFQARPANGTDTATFTITNVSNTAITTAVSHTLINSGGCDSSSFAITSSTCVPEGLAANGGNCAVVVTFTAPDQSTGSTECKFLRVQNLAFNAVVDTEIEATGLGLGVLTFVPGGPADTYFGSQVVGGNSSLRVFEIRNDGSFASGPLDAVFAGDQPGDFIIDTNAATPAGKTRCIEGVTSLDPGASCVFLVRFFPSAGSIVGTNRDATFEVVGGNGGDSTGEADIFGNALAVNSVEISPTFHDFGPEIAGAAVGTTAAVRVFTITNGTGGAVALNAAGAVLQGNDAAQFTIVSDTCPVSLPDNTACQVTVGYLPQVSEPSGTRHFEVELFIANQTYASLEGRVLRQAELVLSPADGPTLMSNSGLVTVNVPTDRVFTLTNLGDVPATGVTIVQAGPNQGEYSVLNAANCATVPGNGSCQFSARILATSGNLKNTTLTISGSFTNSSINEGLIALALVTPSLAISPDVPTIAGTSPGNSTPITGLGGIQWMQVENSIFGGDTGPLSFTLSNPNFVIDWDANYGSNQECEDGHILGPITGFGNFVCFLAVRHQPRTSGLVAITTESTTLTVTDGAISATETINANARPAITISPTSGSLFADVGGSDDQSFTVTLDAETRLISKRVQTRITGANADQFGIEYDNCAGDFFESSFFQEAAGRNGMTSCQLQVSYVPTSAGGKAASLELIITTTEGIDISVSAPLGGGPVP